MHIELYSLVMECPSCKEHFNLQDRRPYNIPCGHTLCLVCIKSLATGGELKCPLDNEMTVVNDPSQLPESRVLIETLTGACVHCATPDHHEACAFCITHLAPTCQLCLHHGTTCSSKDLIIDLDEIKHVLTATLESLPSETWPRTLRLNYDSRFKLSLGELYQLYIAVTRLNSGLQCCDCQNSAQDYVHLTNFCVYCATCYAKNQKKDPQLSAFCVPGPNCHDIVIAKVYEMPRLIHFYLLQPDHYNWLRSPPADLYALLIGAHAFAEMQHKPETELPEVFVCPQCLQVQSRGERQLRKLPCLQAVHVICEPCAQVWERTTCCPLDRQTFAISGLSLPVYFRVVADGAPRIGNGMFLANKGIDIPPFCPPSNSPCLAAAERFFKVLPPLETLVPPTQEERTFMEPWYINFYPNQVEALTFQPFADVYLWGLGLANPVEAGKKALVQWVRLYRGERAISSDYQEPRLKNTELVGGNGVVTDILFTTPCHLSAFAWVTLKLRLGVSGKQEKLPIYHGNHIGRKEDLEGSDGIVWETRQTYCVEESERSSGQQHFIGPILRLIYQNN